MKNPSSSSERFLHGFNANPRMNNKLYLSLLLGAFLSSCYFVDDIFDPPKEKEPSLQVQSQKAVGKYLRLNAEGTYEPFGFSTLTIHKPVEIIELESLEKKNKSQPSVELDSAIAQQKRIIKRGEIERTLDLDHFFTIKDTSGRLTVFETNFILNDTLGVKDISAKIMFQMSGTYEEALTYYFYEYNIFATSSYYESRTLSSDFYSFFKAELEKRNNLQQKSAFLLHVIKLTHQVKKKGAFNQQTILELNVINFMKTRRPDITEYKELTFSELYETQDEKSLEVNGYYFFHKFIGSFEGQLDTNVIMVEFSPYYEIGNIFQMDRPFDPYFNN